VDAGPIGSGTPALGLEARSAHQENSLTKDTSLCAAGLVLHHEPPTITVLLAVITLSTLTVVRLTRALRGLCTPHTS
jgi:hypothetical protein